MARIVNIEEHETKRNEILDAAQRLTYTKGYDQMSIQDILDEVHISKGAFYHYFGSKEALMGALIERITNQIVQLLVPIVSAPEMNATEKLLRAFDVAARWKTARKETLLSLIDVWYGDKNAILRQRTQESVMPMLEPHFTTIICQGVQEGAFHTAYPNQASQILFSLLQSFGDNMIRLITQPDLAKGALNQLDEEAASYQDAVERILGAESGSLPLFDTAILREWFPLSTS